MMTDDEKRELYGHDAAEWLRRWDEGRTVWTIEMGGLGPGYEQCIHMLAAEVIRCLIDNKVDCDSWTDEVFKRDLDLIDKTVFAIPEIKALGVTGAQWGAARNVAIMIYCKGPVAVMTDRRVKYRHIQVSRKFPGAGA